jgi:peptidoglycan/LPS O-acetylase OafA/YrhL
MTRRIEAYDLARTFAIVFVFLGHIIITQTTVFPLKVVFASFSPGLSMSLLGFVSAALLSARDEETGTFLIKRFTRIYIPLFVCLIVVLVMQSFLGTSKINTDTAVHFLGLSGVYSLLSHANNASVGQGLWFVTVILVMYLLLPLLKRLFKHRRGLVHLLIIIALSLVANHWLEAAGAWNVVIAFCIGTYFGVTGRLEGLSRKPAGLYIGLAVCLLGLCALASAKVIPFWFRGVLFPFYPVVFVPLFFLLARVLPRPVITASAFFAAVSYEFYILHFYFTNRDFSDLFGPSIRMAWEIPISFVLTLVVSCVLFVVGSGIRRVADAYFLGEGGREPAGDRGREPAPETAGASLPPGGWISRVRRFVVTPFAHVFLDSERPRC